MNNAGNKPSLEILRIIDRLASIGQQFSQFTNKIEKNEECMTRLVDEELSNGKPIDAGQSINKMRASKILSKNTLME